MFVEPRGQCIKREGDSDDLNAGPVPARARGEVDLAGSSSLYMQRAVISMCVCVCVCTALLARV